MKVKVYIPDYDIDNAILTTEHEASSCNKPVLIINGTAYDLGDVYTPAGSTSGPVGERELFPVDPISESDLKIAESAGWWIMVD